MQTSGVAFASCGMLAALFSIAQHAASWSWLFAKLCVMLNARSTMLIVKVSCSWDAMLALTVYTTSQPCLSLAVVYPCPDHASPRQVQTGYEYDEGVTCDPWHVGVSA